MLLSRKSYQMDPKAKFLRIYANLPLALREEIILVLDDKPLTWNVANIEIENDTKKGKEILDKLVKLEIIK